MTHGKERPVPYYFSGPVRIRRAGATDWSEVPLLYGYTKNSRGIGLADLCYALRSGRPPRASGDLAYHVLDLMHAFHEAAATSRHIEVSSTMTRPTPLPLGLLEGQLDP